jgi:hypothetical protein
LFLWNKGEVEQVEVPLLGARLGAGAMMEAGPVWIDAQVAETLAPYPVRHELEARAHVNILPALAIHLGGGMYWRNMTFEVDGSSIAYHDDEAYFSVGLGTAAR